MAIFERLTQQEGHAQIEGGVHAFASGCNEYLRGAVTAAQLIVAFSLDAGDQAELTAIRDTHNALSTDLEKADFRTKVQDVWILVEQGLYNKAKAKAELGF